MTYNVFGGTLSLAQSQSHSPITFSPTICPQYLSVNLKCFSVVLVVCLSHYILLYVMFMPLLPSTDGEGIVFYGCTSNHPLTLFCDAIPLYLVEGFLSNLVQMFTMWVGIAVKVFRVRGLRSGSYVQICECYSGRGMYFNSVMLHVCFYWPRCVF